MTHTITGFNTKQSEYICKQNIQIGFGRKCEMCDKSTSYAAITDIKNTERICINCGLTTLFKTKYLYPDLFSHEMLEEDIK